MTEPARTGTGSQPLPVRKATAADVPSIQSDSDGEPAADVNERV